MTAARLRRAVWNLPDDELRLDLRRFSRQLLAHWNSDEAEPLH